MLHWKHDGYASWMLLPVMGSWYYLRRMVLSPQLAAGQFAMPSDLELDTPYIVRRPLRKEVLKDHHILVALLRSGQLHDVNANNLKRSLYWDWMKWGSMLSSAAGDNGTFRAVSGIAEGI